MHPAAVRIDPTFVERLWGREDLSPLYPPQSKRIGEVWFDAGSLLIKFLFTSQPLSVQVHPADAYAKEHHNSPGKTEMWHILSATPEARIALGFRQPVSSEEMLRAAEDGSIENLLAWRTPSPGDTFFTPAGTVHAIGAGIVLCEIQQNSDITYRLYDYNRGRKLHLKESLDVADRGSHPGKSVPVSLGERAWLLAECTYFRTELHTGAQESEWPAGSILIVLEGTGTVDGLTFAPGEVWSVKETCRVQSPAFVRLLRCKP